MNPFCPSLVYKHGCPWRSQPQAGINTDVSQREDVDRTGYSNPTETNYQLGATAKLMENQEASQHCLAEREREARQSTQYPPEADKCSLLHSQHIDWVIDHNTGTKVREVVIRVVKAKGSAQPPWLTFTYYLHDLLTLPLNRFWINTPWTASQASQHPLISS